MQGEVTPSQSNQDNNIDTLELQRRQYLHKQIQQKLNIKILEEQNYTTPQLFTRYFDIIKLTPFLAESGQIQQLNKQITFCSNESQYFPAQNLMSSQYFISQSEAPTLLTVALQPPFSFVWSVTVAFARLDYDIIYPTDSFTLTLSQDPNALFPAFQTIFELKITDKPQTFSLPQNLPCVRFAHFNFANEPSQRSPLSLQKMLAISKLETSGVSLDFLALSAMKARNYSRISSKLTRTSLISQMRIRQAVTSIKGFEQTLETVNMIAEQHEHRKALARNLELKIQLQAGSEVEISENAVFRGKWF